MIRPLIGAAMTLLATSALAQVDTDRCATVTVSSATAKDLPTLIGDAECYGKAAVSASTSQATRLAKAKALAALPPVVSPVVPVPVAARVDRQVNLSGGEYGQTSGRLGTDYVYPSRTTLAYFRAKGVSTFRLPVKWERLQPTASGPLDDAKVAEVKAVADLAQQLGARLILDLHNYGGRDGRKLGGDGLPVSALGDFWGRFATALGRHPAIVGFDLMNEPNGLKDFPSWPRSAQSAIDAIRKVDTTTPIYVEGDQYSTARNWPGANPELVITDPAGRLIYSAHIYLDRDASGTHFGTAAQEGTDIGRGPWMLQPFIAWCKARKVQCHIGEYGVPADASWQPVLAALYATLDANADTMTGAAWWAAGEWWGDYPLSVQPKDGADKPQLKWMLP